MTDNLKNLESKSNWLHRLAYNPYVVGGLALALIALLLWAMLK